MKYLFAKSELANNLIKISIKSLNSSIHVLLFIFNLSRIEQYESFTLLNQGMCGSTEKYIIKLDDECSEIAKIQGHTVYFHSLLAFAHNVFPQIQYQNPDFVKKNNYTNNKK